MKRKRMTHREFVKWYFIVAISMTIGFIMFFTTLQNMYDSIYIYFDLMTLSNTILLPYVMSVAMSLVIITISIECAVECVKQRRAVLRRGFGYEKI